MGKTTKPTTVNLTARVPATLHHQLRVAAVRRRETLGTMLARAIERELARVSGSGK